jgi:hypothetical protein
MKTVTGTSHFESRFHAIRYYSYGFTAKQVDEKLEAEEITIGRPTLKPGERLEVNGEGRYVIISQK